MALEKLLCSCTLEQGECESGDLRACSIRCFDDYGTEYKGATRSIVMELDTVMGRDRGMYGTVRTKETCLSALVQVSVLL